MAKLIRTKPKAKTGHRARKKVNVVTPTPAGGNHRTRRTEARAQARAMAELKRAAHEALMAKQAAEKAARDEEALGETQVEANDMNYARDVIERAHDEALDEAPQEAL